MDITHLFKAGVLSAKHRRKTELDPQRILAPTNKKASAPNVQRDQFSKQAKDVCQKITNLRNVLLENRSAYMRIGQHLKNAAQMTDEQRNLIDTESEKFVTFYTQYLGQMRNDWKKTKSKKQQNEHIEAVIELLTVYLRSVQQIYLEQKKYRVQHELETYGLLKLASDKKKIPVRPAGEHRKISQISSTSSRLRSENSESESNDTSEVQTTSNDGWDLDEDDITAPLLNGADNEWDVEEETSMLKNTSTSSAMTDSKAQVALEEDMQKSQQQVEAEKSLSPEDIQMFEEENVQLYHELQGLSEEVESIEKNVVDIATLQDIFTEKVILIVFLDIN